MAFWPYCLGSWMREFIHLVAAVTAPSFAHDRTKLSQLSNTEGHQVPPNSPGYQFHFRPTEASKFRKTKASRFSVSSVCTSSCWAVLYTVCKAIRFSLFLYRVLTNVQSVRIQDYAGPSLGRMHRGNTLASPESHDCSITTTCSY